jgi:four helix bundle protein
VEQKFSHEKLDVYRLSVDFLTSVRVLGKEVPLGNADLFSQLRRASSSICLNIAEGAGKYTQLDKKRFYGIARGSAMGCAAVLDVLEASELLPKVILDPHRATLVRIVSMLSKLIRK